MIGRLTLAAPWLSLDFDNHYRVLSWAINRPGFVETDRLLWREVRNADLPKDLDVRHWLDQQLAARGDTEAVTFLTSRDIVTFEDETVSVDDVTVRCVATVGLSNAEHIGTRVDRSGKDWGTINVAVCTEHGLTDAARIEALSITSQARTVAVMNAGLKLPMGLATGTGTDCIAIAAPLGDTGFAGMHTALGEAVGQAVLRAVGAGVSVWMETVRRKDAL